jgi:hypothetical protein
MGKHLLQKRMLKDVGQKMILSDFNVKGRKPNASGGLADILQVPREGYAQAGPVGPQRVFPPGTGTKTPLIDPYDEFFLYQNKLMRKKKGLAKILEV